MKRMWEAVLADATRGGGTVYPIRAERGRTIPPFRATPGRLDRAARPSPSGSSSEVPGRRSYSTPDLLAVSPLATYDDHKRHGGATTSRGSRRVDLGPKGVSLIATIAVSVSMSAAGIASASNRAGLCSSGQNGYGNQYATRSGFIGVYGRMITYDPARANYTSQFGLSHIYGDQTGNLTHSRQSQVGLTTGQPA